MRSEERATAAPNANSSSNPGRAPPPPLRDGARGEIKHNQEDQLEAIIVLNERRAELSGVAVVVGLALELIFAFLFRDKKPWVEYWSPIISDAVITLGVAGEILFARKASSAQSMRQHLADEQIAQTKERAAKAEHETEKLRLQLSWRRLSPTALSLMSQVLSVYAKASVRITFVGNDPESNAFAHDFGALFKHNGWSVIFTSGTFSGPVIFGLIIAQPSLEQDIDACAVVRTAANNAGIQYFGGFIPQPFMAAAWGDDISGPKAEIYVGPRPMPKLE